MCSWVGDDHLISNKFEWNKKKPVVAGSNSVRHATVLETSTLHRIFNSPLSWPIFGALRVDKWKITIFWLITGLALWEGKITRIWRCDWLSDGANLSARDNLLCPERKNSVHFSMSWILYWPSLLNQRLKTCKKRYLGQYPSILTSRLVNNPYITTLTSSRQVKKLFHSLTLGEVAVRAQRKTLEKIQRNIAGKPAQLKTSEARMVKWIKEYNRSSWKEVQGLSRSFLLWCALLDNVVDLYNCSFGGDHSFLSCQGRCMHP